MAKTKFKQLGSDVAADTGQAIADGTGNVILQRASWTAGAAPANSNDNTQGYRRGSQWIYRSGNRDEIYICIDDSTGAAIWQRVDWQSWAPEITQHANLSVNIGTTDTTDKQLTTFTTAKSMYTASRYMLRWSAVVASTGSDQAKFWMQNTTDGINPIFAEFFTTIETSGDYKVIGFNELYIPATDGTKTFTINVARIATGGGAQDYSVIKSTFTIEEVI